MKKIKIFIAGSKELMQERNQIKVLANDLNSKYSVKDTLVIIHSYEHFDDKQDEYNRFIEQEADIVIFILDGHIGDKTEEEFMKATDALNKKHRPQVMVFLHDFNEMTPDIARIQGLIKGRLGDRYYIDYSDLSELKAKADDRITRYIDHCGEEAADPVSPAKEVVAHTEAEEMKRSISRKVKVLLYSMLGLIVILSGLLLSNVFSSSDILIFAGGGSVRNYIKETRDVDIVGYPHSVYANLASGSAWALLAEEASRYQEDGGKGQEYFSSICLSADDIDSTFINEKTKSMFVNARVIRYNLGQDPLVVYVHKKVASDMGIPDKSGSICVDSLRLLVKYALSRPEEVRIFTTSKTSGTLRHYQSCFNASDSIDFEKLLDQKQSFLFYKESRSAYINALDIPNSNKPYIILGSQYYYPKTLDAENEKHYLALFVEKGHNRILKPMNIYFIGKYYGDKGDYCTIKKPIIQFLKDIHAEENIDPDTWRELISGKKKTEGGNLILRLN